MLPSFGNSLGNDRRLFRYEIRASIAHCNGLFRAGVITRIEAERLKNGLWTILKRADFDGNYFDNSSSPDVFGFLEARLFQLVNEAANALKIGRSQPHRATLALRLWLRDEAETTGDLLENLSDILQTQQNNTALATFAKSFKQDKTRFREIAQRTNQMPIPVVDQTDEATAEIDFDLIAHELGFSEVLENSFDSANDRDFCIEFAGVTALTGLHLSNLANAVLDQFEQNTPNRQALEIVRGKSVKTFGYQTILLSLLNRMPNQASGELNEVCEIVFDAADTLKLCLQTVTKVLSAVSL